MLPRNRKNLRDDLPVGAEYPLAIAMALKSDLRDSANAVKVAARWTGASERTVQNWLNATRGPKGEHLLALARHSNAVHAACLVMTGRAGQTQRDLDACVELLLKAIDLLSRNAGA
ncbi:hypothetical protein AWB80_03363 [Caballeronia pedi]|uniref:Uncharacterized protein n=1 Tax=Caballeronia pedi TaxID=1777141 RepID=A0A158BCT5_9BURK|nr:hypothetical protein [Caballeronia pedi]SAK67882.1 hypothetical protein AWB80_03363 [Caballeronia pedi]